VSTKPKLTIVVMGLDADGKPHAGAYPADMADTAAKDAAAWKLRVCKAETDAAQALAERLPTGKMFPSAKMELPVIRRDTYDMLLKTVKCDLPPLPAQPAQAAQAAQPGAKGGDGKADAKGPAKPNGSDPKAAAKPTPPNPKAAEKAINPWDLLVVGSTVLATVDASEGYFPAQITAISSDGKRLTCKWKDYPKLPTFNVRRLAVGLLAVVK